MLITFPTLACAGGSSESDSAPAPAAGDESAENTAATPSQEALIGCWNVHAGEWRDVPEQAAEDGKTLTETPPTWLVRLDSAEAPRLFEGAEPGRAAATYLEDAWRDHPFQRWRVVNDSIVIDHPAAFAGTTLRVAPEDAPDREESMLVGLAVAHTDVAPADAPAGGPPPRRYAAVRMYRLECPE